MTCSACGGRVLEPHLRVRVSPPTDLTPATDRYGQGLADLVRCSSCGHAQVERFPETADLETAYEVAEEDEQLAEEPGQRATAARALMRIERHVPVGSVCDLGCWVGSLLAEAEHRGWEAWGVEPSRFASGVARDRVRGAILTASIDDVDLPVGRFGAVVLADVVEHLVSPLHALRRVAGLLDPNGVVYVAVPDAGSLVARALGPRWWSVLPGHLHHFTRESMRRLLERADLRIEWMGTAPKSFSVRYYVGRLRGYSPRVAAALGRAVESAGLADRVITPDFHDRMAVVARRSP